AGLTRGIRALPEKPGSRRLAAWVGHPAGWFVGSWPVRHSRSQPPNCAGGWEAVAHAATGYEGGTWEDEGATDSQVSAPSGCPRPPTRRDRRPRTQVPIAAELPSTKPLVAVPPRRASGSALLIPIRPGPDHLQERVLGEVGVAGVVEGIGEGP